MKIEKSYSTAQLSGAVEGILKGLTAGGSLGSELSMDALAYVTALIMDLDPSVTARSHMRQTVEEQAASTLLYLRAFREHFEKSGEHLLEAIGGRPELGPNTVEGMTRQ